MVRSMRAVSVLTAAALMAATVPAHAAPRVERAEPDASRATTAPARPTRAPSDLVDLARVAPTVLHDIRYATKHNFVGRAIRGYVEPRCLLTRAAATRLAQVQRDMRRRGYSLKVYDCYRPQRAVDDFVAWAKRPADTRMKREFYPRVDKSRLFADGYIAEKSGHSRASTVDLTLVRLPAKRQRQWSPRLGLQPCYWPRARRFADTSIDMGTGYDCFDTRAHTADARSTPTQRANRQVLVAAMQRRGFVNYDQEWWHFTLKNEPHPSTYFDSPVSRASVRGH